ncbi:hypothetical protein pb186bvf_006131 [Paramecium bursaria]
MLIWVFSVLAYLSMIVILVFQLRRRWDVGSKRTSKKCLISYASIGNFIILIIAIFSGKLLEPYYRLLTFLLVYYYLTRKLMNLSHRAKQNKRLLKKYTIFVGIFVFICALLTLIQQIRLEPNSLCEFPYHLISKILGLVFTAIFILFSYRLQNKLDAKVQPQYKDNPLLQMKTFQDNESQREDLQILVVTYLQAQFITIAVEVYTQLKFYYTDKEFSNCIDCQLIPCLDMSVQSTELLEYFMQMIIEVFTIFLPYIALIQFFWVGAKKEKLQQSQYSNDDDILANFFKQMGHPGLGISDISEKLEKSSLIYF